MTAESPVSPARSTGHILFTDTFEFYELAGEVFRAPKDAPINDCISNVRSGRWECGRAHFNLFRAVITGETLDV